LTVVAFPVPEPPPPPDVCAEAAANGIDTAKMAIMRARILMDVGYHANQSASSENNAGNSTRFWENSPSRKTASYGVEALPMISILIALIILGFLLYLITLSPLDPTIKQIIRVVIIFFVVIWLLNILGAFGGHFGLGFGASRPCGVF
jgi:hypothetical protein